MILMSKYKGQHGGKKGKKFGQGPPPFRAMPERNRFFPNGDNDDDVGDDVEGNG